jgi:hypothetical protein
MQIQLLQFGVGKCQAVMQLANHHLDYQ